MPFPILGLSVVEFVVLVALASAASALVIVFLFRRIRSYGDYAYTNARVSAMKGRTFRKEKLNTLVNSRDLQNLIGLLEDSSVSIYLREVEVEDPRDLELSLRKYSSDSYDKLISIAPEAIDDILQEIESVSTIKNIKTILSGKHAGAPRNRIEERLYPRGNLPDEVYERALDAGGVKEAAESFEETRYWDSMKEALDEFEETGSLLPLWSSLEEGYWRGVWRKIKISSAENKDVLKKAVGTEIDLENMMKVLRCKAGGVDPESIRGQLVPIHSGIDGGTLERATEAEHLEEALTVLSDSDYEGVVSDARNAFNTENSILALERTIQEFLLRRLRTLAIQHSTGAGPLIAFLYERNAEVKNLTTIANGKSEGLDSEEIERRILAPEVRR